MSDKKFNVKYGLSVGTGPVVDVIDTTGAGNFVDLSATGNVNLGNLITANYVAGTITTAAQPNITELGSLTNLVSNGTVNFTGASNVSLGNVGNVKITGGANAYVLSTNGNGTLDWTAPGLNYKYTKEWHVDPVNGNNTTGDGSYNKPYATVAKAITSTGPGYAQVVYLHAGAYTENVTIVSPAENIEIIGVNDTGTTIFSGTWAFSHTGTSIRVRNVRFSAAVTQTSTGPVYFDDCTFSSFTKSGTGYTQFDLCDVTSASFTSNALTLARGGSISGLTLNNASARVYVYNMTTVSVITVTAGIFFAFDSTLYSSTTTTNAITASAGTTVGVYRTQITNSSGTLSRVSLAGNWTINDSTYDQANSTLTGTNLGTVSHFDAINVRGVSTLGNVGNVRITGGSNGQVLTTNGSGNLTWGNVTVSPGGSNTQIQFNDANTFGGSSALTFDKSTNALSVSGSFTASGNVTAQGTGSNITRRAFGLVATDTAVTLDDLSASVTTNNQLKLVTTGSWQGTGWTETFAGSTPTVSYWINLPLNPGYEFASGAMSSQGHGCKCVISDQTPNAKMYQITVIRSGTTGSMWNISIERLV